MNLLVMRADRPVAGESRAPVPLELPPPPVELVGSDPELFRDYGNGLGAVGTEANGLYLVLPGELVPALRLPRSLRKFSVRLRPRVARDLLCGFLMLAALDSIVKRCVRLA